MSHEHGHEALQYELLREQAGALGRAGANLQAALQKYAEFTAKSSTIDLAQEAVLLDDIAARVWELAVQRELTGFSYDNMRWIQSTFNLPPAALRRLGLHELRDER